MCNQKQNNNIILTQYYIIIFLNDSTRVGVLLTQRITVPFLCVQRFIDRLPTNQQIIINTKNVRVRGVHICAHVTTWYKRKVHTRIKL